MTPLTRDEARALRRSGLIQDPKRQDGLKRFLRFYGTRDIDAICDAKTRRMVRAGKE